MVFGNRTFCLMKPAFWFAAVVLTVLPSFYSRANCAVSRGAEYIAKCKQHNASVFDGQAVVSLGKGTPTAWEARGTLNGVAVDTRTGTYTLLLQLDNSASLSVTGSGQCPDIPVGTRIRILVQDKPSSSGTYEPVPLAVATEAEVQSALLAARSSAKSGSTGKSIRTSRTTKPSSRGFYYGAEREWGVSAVVEAYKRAVAWFNPRLSEPQLETIARCVLGFSSRYGVDPRLVMAVLAVESGFKLDATSRKGAMGLGQLMPATARGLGVTNAYDPVQNIEASVRLIRGHLERFSGKNTMEQLALALASYNAGSGAVRKYGGIPPYRETRNYIRKVAAWYKHFCGG